LHYSLKTRQTNLISCTPSFWRKKHPSLLIPICNSALCAELLSTIDCCNSKQKLP